MCAFVFFFKQKTAYEMRISDWSSDVCSSDLADRQTSGRGRLGRAWGDGQGNFMGSTVVRLTAGDPAPATLALVVGVALARVVAAVAPDVPIQLKSPNDLLVAGAQYAGSLLELTGGPVVVGVGVHRFQAPALSARERKTREQR